MELFVRESGLAGSPTIVFLHGAEYSGRSWEPVVKHLPRYRCLLPDLPQHGASLQSEPFDIGRAAAAVAELIRSRGDTGRVHLVGHSLGAQVGAQLLATEPDIVDRAVLCGAVINTLPGAWLTRLLLGAFAGMSRSIKISQAIHAHAHPAGPVSTEVGHDRGDVPLMPAEQISEIVVASAGFTLPEALDRSDSPTLFLTGTMELPFVQQSAAALARQMPNGVDGLARGMPHNWPLRYPGTFARTVDGWLSDTAVLPSRIELSNSDRR
jgi:pimeloyl-ACP methyl ester carboxylesterase